MSPLSPFSASRPVGSPTMLYGGQPLPTINPIYGGKVISLCAPDDPICSGGGNIIAHVSHRSPG